MKAYILIIFLALSAFTYSEELIRTEYYIDNDPGYGKGIEIKGYNNQKIDFNVSLDGLKTGMHRIYIRSLDENGSWSHTTGFSFIVREEEAKTQKAEYFIDNDTGRSAERRVGKECTS